MPIKIPMALNGSFMESGQGDLDSADEGPLQASSSLANFQVPVSKLLSHASIVCLLRQHPCKWTSLAQLDTANATLQASADEDCKAAKSQAPPKVPCTSFPTSFLLYMLAFAQASSDCTLMWLQIISGILSSVLQVMFDDLCAHAVQAAGQCCANQHCTCRCSGKVSSMLMTHMPSLSSRWQQRRAAIYVWRGFPCSSIFIPCVTLQARVCSEAGAVGRDRARASGGACAGPLRAETRCCERGRRL